MKDPDQRLRALVAAYADSTWAPGPLALANLIEAADTAGRKEDAAAYRKRLREILEHSGPTPEAKLLA